MPGVIIIEDEFPARRGLRRMLEKHEDVHVLAEADDLSGARALVEEHRPDVVFLDVEIPGGGGFDLLESLSRETRIVFVTAHSQHAAKAFEVGALDYILKPVRAERVAQALDRVRQSCAQPVMRVLDGVPRHHITLRDKKRTLVLPLEKVAALVADGDFTLFMISGEKPMLMGTTLGVYESRLPGYPFVRIGRSLIINILQINSLEILSRDVALLKLLGVVEPLELGRTATAKLREVMASC